MRVGLIGAGLMGKTHAAAWANTPAQFTGVYSLVTSQAQQLSEKHQIKCYDNLDELIDSVDVIDICTPTDTHHELILKAAAAGKNIVCEKPLARTLEQGIEALEACKKAGVTLLVAHVVRFFPEYAQAKNIVTQGDIGKVAIVRLKRCSAQPGWATNSWLLDPERSGGMILDLMIHDFDYARWVAGEVVSVFAKSVRSKTPESSGDYGLVILRHENGAISNIEGAWAYPPGMFRTALEIAGDGGLIEHPTGSSVPLNVHFHEQEDENAPVQVPGSPLDEDPYTTQIKHFYDVLSGKDVSPRVTAEDGLMALKIGLAAIESAKTGKPVQLKEAK